MVDENRRSEDVRRKPHVVHDKICDKVVTNQNWAVWSNNMMEKMFLVFVLLSVLGVYCEEELEARLNGLTVELEEKLPTKECNQTLENLQVIFFPC